jgi:hypothetical protein
MPRLSRLVPALALGFALLPAAAFADGRTPRVDHREWHQQHRVYNGVRSGALTPRETRRLAHEQRAIRGFERHAKSDGVVTRRERAHLRHMQNRASRDIYRQKHDGQLPEPRYFP